MGYTLSVKVKPEVKDKVLDFFEKNYKTFPELFGEPKDEYSSWLSDDLSYCHKKNHIGFDYNCCGAENHYIYTLIRWLAIRVGDKTKAGTPRCLYDGDEWIEVKPDLYDEYGVDTDNMDDYTRNEFTRYGREYKVDLRDVLRAEMKRLDALWKEQNHV